MKEYGEASNHVPQYARKNVTTVRGKHGRAQFCGATAPRRISIRIVVAPEPKASAVATTPVQ